MNDLFKYLNKNKKNEMFITATVTTLNPLTVKIIPTDDAINVVYTNNLMGISVGSRILLLKYLDQFIGIAILGTLNIEKCILRKETAQTIPNATSTKITFSTGTEISDTLSMHDTSTNNSRITILSDGFYNISVGARWTESASGSGRVMYIFVNNSAVAAQTSTQDSSGRSGNSLSINYYLSKDDYVEMAVYQASGGNLDIGGTTYYALNFSVIKV